MLWASVKRIKFTNLFDNFCQKRSARNKISLKSLIEMQKITKKNAITVAACVLFLTNQVFAKETIISHDVSSVTPTDQMASGEINSLNTGALNDINFSNTDALIGSIIYVLSPFLSNGQIEELIYAFQTADPEFSDIQPQKVIDRFNVVRHEAGFNEKEFKFQLLTQVASEIGIKLAMVDVSPVVKADGGDVGIGKSSSDFGDLIYALPLLALGGGGGGGGGGTPDVTCGGGACAPIYTEASFQTTEYNNQAGLGLVKAAAVYSYGGSGSGVTVAFFDSGVLSSHSELSGRILGGYDFVNGSAGVTADPNGHGTHVAGIIAAGRGSGNMQGVAYNATLLPIRIANASGVINLSDSVMASALDYSLNAGVGVNNHSWGSSTAVTSVNAAFVNSNYPLQLAAARRAAAAGQIQVFATGNNGRTEPSLQAGQPHLFPDLAATWLAVMAVDLNGAEPNYTNRCGVAAAWCIAAPGGADNSATGGVYSTTNDGAYGRMSGTSMAAPHVAGGIAALKSRFPNLSYTQIRDRILTTANRTGAYANSSIYGQGLMDLSAAASPVGVLAIPLSGNLTALKAPLGSSNLKIPSTLFSSFDFKPDQSVLVLDAYQNAPFSVATSEIIKTNSTTNLRFDPNSLFTESDWSFGDLKRTANFKNTRSYTNRALSGNSDGSNKWYVGSDLVGNLTFDLGFSTRLPTASNEPLIGFSTELRPGFMGSVRVGSWVSLRGDAEPTNGASTADNGPLPNMQSGLAAIKAWQIGEGYAVNFGTAVGQARNSLNYIDGREAFATPGSSILTNWVGVHKSSAEEHIGITSIGFTLKRTTISTSDRTSLLKMPKRLGVFDIEASGLWVLPSNRTKFKVGLATSFADGNPYAVISLPSSIDEAGNIAFREFRGSLNSSLQQHRLSLRLEHAYNRTTQLRLITKVQQSSGKTQKMIGVGLVSKWH
jgi:subtilisin family serine protease